MPILYSHKLTIGPLTLCLALSLLSGCQSMPTQQPGTANTVNPQFELDRQAILAMAGSFEVSFNFDETIAVRPGYELAESYQSGGLEWVTVLEDAGQRIVLQHVLVACGEPDETETNDSNTYSDSIDEQSVDLPLDIDEDCFPIKHWRQDWVYQDTVMTEYRGYERWIKTTLPAEQVRGTWSQAVYQVDDSPRYEGYGRWNHEANQSVWESNITWRPLPRREYTIRDDYQVLMAINRHVVTANGWHHEQDNYKLDLENDSRQPVIAREKGLNNYLPIDAPELRIASEYMHDTDQFWAAVRQWWQQQFAHHDQLNIAKQVDDQAMYERMFDLADEYKGAQRVNTKMQHDIRQALAAYVEPQTAY